MKLIKALEIINERDKLNRRTEKGMQQTTMILRGGIDDDSEEIWKDRTDSIVRNKVSVQSVLPQKDVVALQMKTGESSTREAISKAVHHYLKCQNTDDDGDSLPIRMNRWKN